MPKAFKWQSILLQHKTELWKSLGRMEQPVSLIRCHVWSCQAHFPGLKPVVLKQHKQSRAVCEPLVRLLLLKLLRDCSFMAKFRAKWKIFQEAVNAYQEYRIFLMQVRYMRCLGEIQTAESHSRLCNFKLFRIQGPPHTCHRVEWLLRCKQKGVEFKSPSKERCFKTQTRGHR